MVIFDANMILRYLLNDNVEMADQAEKYLSEEKVTVTIEVISEVIYVFKGVYNMDRNEISNTVLDFLQIVECRDMEVLKLAVKIYGTENVDFVDCVLYSYHQVNGYSIATFDKKLLKLLNDV